MKIIGLFFLLGWLSNCSSFSSRTIAKGAIQIRLSDVRGKRIRRAKVFRVGEDGQRYRAKKSQSGETYCFPNKNFAGTLYLKHPSYQNEVYPIEDLSIHLQHSKRLSLFLRKKKQGVFTQAGIRYPYIPQTNRIALMLQDTVAYNGEVYRQETIQHLLKLGAVYGSVHREKGKRYFRKRIFIGDFLAQILYLPEALDTDARTAISDYLFSVDHRVQSGLLLGTGSLLSRELFIQLLDPKNRVKALEFFQKEGLILIAENPRMGNPIAGYFRVQVPTLETEKLIEIVDRLNEMDLFYPIGLNTRPIFWADL